MRRLVVFSPVLLSACSGVQASLDPAGQGAAEIRKVWDLMLWVCGAMYLLVLLFLAWAIWRSRKALAGPPIAEGHESAVERPMQRALTGWTVLIVVGLLVLTVGSFLVDRRLAQANEEGALNIKVTGAQWWWKVEYQDADPSKGIVTANELRLPAGRPARLTLVADDVIHSFWIPNLGGKQDLIPGRTNYLTLRPTRPGLYRGQCAEFCGLQHARMALDATVDPPEAFEAWRAAQQRPAPPPSTPLQARGQEVFLGNACSSCHQIAGTPAGGRTGPNLSHFASRRTLAAGSRPNTPDHLKIWLKDPHTVKPGNHMPIVRISDADLDALVAYLGSLT